MVVKINPVDFGLHYGHDTSKPCRGAILASGGTNDLLCSWGEREGYSCFEAMRSFCLRGLLKSKRWWIERGGDTLRRLWIRGEQGRWHTRTVDLGWTTFGFP